MKRVLVTGAGGFVGSALARGFAARGWEVFGVDRRSAAGPTDPGSSIRWIITDLADGVPPEVPPVDLVVHAAWVTTDPATLGVSPGEYLGLNLRPLLAVLEHVSRTSPADFVFLSSSGVFAPGDGTDVLSDGDRPTGTSPYAVGKRAAELLVPAALGPGGDDASDGRGAGEHRAGRTAVHVVRLGYLYGPGEAARETRLGLSLVARWVAAAREGRPLEVRSDDPVRDWTCTSDLAAALERLVEGGPAGRPVHVGSPHRLTDGAVAALVAAGVEGARLVSFAPDGPVKAPMAPSDIPALYDVAWTEPTVGVRALMAEEVPA